METDSIHIRLSLRQCLSGQRKDKHPGTTANERFIMLLCRHD